eukprot:scaffold101202_cov55-Attheya_sp.AAC.1
MGPRASVTAIAIVAVIPANANAIVQVSTVEDAATPEAVLQASRETTVAVAPCPCDPEEETAVVPFVAEEETTTNEEVEKEAVEVITPDSTTKDLPVEQHHIAETDPHETTVKAVDLQKATASLAEKSKNEKDELVKAIANTNKHLKKWRENYVNERDDTPSITPKDVSEKLSKHCCELVHMRDYEPRDGLELGVTRPADQSILLQATAQEPLIGMYVSGSSQISQVSTQTQDAFPKNNYVDSLQDNSVPPAVGEDPSALQMDANLEDKEVTAITSHIEAESSNTLTASASAKADDETTMSIDLLADATKKNEAKDDIATTVTLQLLPLQDQPKRNKLKLNRKRTHPTVSGQTRPFRHQREEEADAITVMPRCTEDEESIMVTPATMPIVATPNQQVQQYDSQETRLEVLQPMASTATSMHLISGKSVTPFTNDFILLWDEINSGLKIPIVAPPPVIATVRAPPP